MTRSSSVQFSRGIGFITICVLFKELLRFFKVFVLTSSVNYYFLGFYSSKTVLNVWLLLTGTLLTNTGGSSMPSF